MQKIKYRIIKRINKKNLNFSEDEIKCTNNGYFYLVYFSKAFSLSRNEI